MVPQNVDTSKAKFSLRRPRYLGASWMGAVGPTGPPSALLLLATRGDVVHILDPRGTRYWDP